MTYANRLRLGISVGVGAGVGRGHHTALRDQSGVEHPRRHGGAQSSTLSGRGKRRDARRGAGLPRVVVGLRRMRDGVLDGRSGACRRVAHADEYLLGAGGVLEPSTRFLADAVAAPGVAVRPVKHLGPQAPVIGVGELLRRQACRRSRSPPRTAPRARWRRGRPSSLAALTVPQTARPGTETWGRCRP